MTWDIILEVAKFIGVGIFGIIAWYTKGIAASIKCMEKDISDIKQYTEINKIINSQMQHSIDDLIKWKSRVEQSENEFWKKYGSKLKEL